MACDPVHDGALDAARHTHAHQQAPRAYFGADVADLTAADVEALGWATRRGVKLLAVAGCAGHGFFTHEIVRGLDGEARSGDGEIRSLGLATSRVRLGLS